MAVPSILQQRKGDGFWAMPAQVLGERLEMNVEKRPTPNK